MQMGFFAYNQYFNVPLSGGMLKCGKENKGLFTFSL